jgi:hypothetical protein
MAGNDEYGAARETVLAETRAEARALASEGLLPREIAHRLDHGLTATERELLWGIASQAVAEARRTPVQKSSPRRASLQSPESSAGGPGLQVVRGLWKQAKRWAPGRGVGGRTRFQPAVVPVALAAVAVGVVLGLLLANDGHEVGKVSPRVGAASKHRPGSASSGKTGALAKSRRRSAPAPTGSSPARPPVLPNGGVHPGTLVPRTGAANAVELNDRGFQLMQAGRYREAIPLLRRAVSTSPPESNDMTHAYALFNLGRSLRLAGRAEEAIPLLERRLRIDNQRATVARELAAARRSATSTGGAQLR